MKTTISLLFLFLISTSAFAQGALQATSNIPFIGKEGSKVLGCGHYHHMEHTEKHVPGYIEQANRWLEDVAVQEHYSIRSAQQKLEIPVVFHVLWNDSTENLPDSVILDQLQMINEHFNRTHSDTSATRSEFKSVAASADIEFKLADIDPQGQPTNGIVRVNTPVTHFGGVLPYAPGQTALIQQWVADSFYLNLFRVSDPSQGGSAEWNKKIYLNIWIGDMRIFEPQFNNFEELVFFGLATNPAKHPNWPDSVLPSSITTTGVVLHYLNVGSNNPNQFGAPYTIYNGVTNTGKIAIHEVGHYLGLRHLWGDGNCTMDDYIDDTPLQGSNSAFDCSFMRNSCQDSSMGPDQVDMVENYMDYSSGDCQNMFTANQVALMRDVWLNYRTEPGPPAHIAEVLNPDDIILFPNPADNFITLVSRNADHGISGFAIQDLSGRTLVQRDWNGKEERIELELPGGIYLLSVKSSEGEVVKRFVKN